MWLWNWKFSNFLVLIQHPWNDPFWFFLALVPLNIVRPCWNFDQRKSNKTYFLKNPSKFGSSGTTLLVPFWWVWGNNSSKQRQIELKFLPREDLIALQMPLKEFWKSQIFTETERTQNLSFWSNFDLNLPPEDSQNQK